MRPLRPSQSRASRYALTVLLLAALLFAGCKQKPADVQSERTTRSSLAQRAADVAAYQMIQAELVLANMGKPYLVLDFPGGELELKLKGAVVWEYPLEIASDDSDEVRKFARRFLGEEGKPVRVVAEKYLFAAQGKNPDTLLAIVSGALNIDPGLLQRDVPSRFQIRWQNNLILDVSTDVVAKPKSKLKNTLIEVGQVLQRPFGEARISMKMQPEAAITFWRAVEVGVPTLVRPPP